MADSRFASELPICCLCCETLGSYGGPVTLPCGAFVETTCQTLADSSSLVPACDAKKKHGMSGCQCLASDHKTRECRKPVLVWPQQRGIHACAGPLSMNGPSCSIGDLSAVHRSHQSCPIQVTTVAESVSRPSLSSRPRQRAPSAEHPSPPSSP